MAEILAWRRLGPPLATSAMPASPVPTKIMVVVVVIVTVSVVRPGQQALSSSFFSSFSAASSAAFLTVISLAMSLVRLPSVFFLPCGPEARFATGNEATGRGDRYQIRAVGGRRSRKDLCASGWSSTVGSGPVATELGCSSSQADGEDSRNLFAGCPSRLGSVARARNSSLIMAKTPVAGSMSCSLQRWQVEQVAHVLQPQRQSMIPVPNIFDKGNEWIDGMGKVKCGKLERRTTTRTSPRFSEQRF
ncbi:hypothetical protein QBC37DRAFT_402271 [Rhypophila decipiens]|uniref:Uncharacterized protein n=1 Tax=Rhypophila decipiens TaxID=261697 RepID=A0AAN6Y2X9_9PEZI|nr:hypothetical protein QBC37DRAFT_402271 [Rhypophila decipiens]